MLECLKDIFIENKEKIAYRSGDEFITYGELYEKALHYSSLLKKQGTSPVIIYGHKSISMMVSMIACIFADRTYVPTDTSMPERRIKRIIEETGAGLIITNEELSLDTAAQKHTLEQLEDHKNASFKGDESENKIIYIIFTSGSTGTPKGIPISEENLLNFSRWISQLKPLDEYKNARVLNQACFSFDLSVADIFYSLLNGHTLVALNKNDIGENHTLDVISENEINVMVITPTFIKMCLLDPSFTEENFPSLKCMYFCGEMLDKKTAGKIFSAFPDMEIINAYGPTEATSAVSGIRIDRRMLEDEKALPVGELDTAAVDIFIDDGEIILKGKSVFSGYIDGRDGGHFRDGDVDCYRTGDNGYIEGNRLYCCGRKDDQIKLKGYRIELEDIEENLRSIAGVEDCAVVAKRKDDGEVRMIKAFVVGGSCDEEHIKRELKKSLPDYMIPKVIKKIEKLPVNNNGKTDRKLLSQL